MRILSSLLKKIKSPSFIGFGSAIGVYLLGGVALFGVMGGEKDIRLKQEGSHTLTLKLASIDNGGNQTKFTQEITPPTPPKEHKPKKRKKPKRDLKSPRPIPQNQPKQEQPISKPSVASNVTQEGSRKQTLAHNEGVSDEFLSKIHAAISLHNPYPRIARMRKMEGEVVLEFILDINGSLEEVRILSSTASEILNKSAIKAVYRASKDFPIPSQKVKIKVPIVYSLRA